MTPRNRLTANTVAEAPRSGLEGRIQASELAGPSFDTPALRAPQNEVVEAARVRFALAYRALVLRSCIGQPLALQPKALRRRVVARSRGRLLDPALDEIFPGHPFDLRRRREIDDRVGALFRRDEEQSEETDQTARDAAAGIAEPRGDGAGMEAIGGALGPVQAPGELAGEQDIGELRAAVDSEPVVTLGALQVAEVEAHALVGAR